MKKVAILGGTFNPIHNGHIMAIHSVYDTKKFDEIWLMPSGVPPFKENISSNANERFEMCRLVSNTIPYVKVSDIEIKDKKKSYTFKTLNTLKEKYKNTKFYWIIGYDIIDQIELWYNSEELLKTFDFIVFNRGGYSREEFDLKLNKLEQKYNIKFVRLGMPSVEISSTSLRQRAVNGESLIGYTPDVICNYIEKNKIYG